MNKETRNGCVRRAFLLNYRQPDELFLNPYSGQALSFIPSSQLVNKFIQIAIHKTCEIINGLVDAVVSYARLWVVISTDLFRTFSRPDLRSTRFIDSARRFSSSALRTREKHPKQDMDFALFQRITGEMREAGVEEIGLFYLGESTSNPELLVKALRHVKDLGFSYMFLTTNGTMLDADLARDLFIGGLDSLKFSMNAADEEQYERIMGVKGRLLWDAVKNLQAAKGIRDDLGARCGIIASSIQYDGEQGERMRRFLDAYVLPFVDQHYCLPLYSMGSLARSPCSTTATCITSGS